MKDEPISRQDGNRRRFLRTVTSAGGLALAGCATAPAGGGRGGASHGESHDEAEVTPGEDLMQEHGVLERVLLLYEEAAGRAERGEAFDAGVVASAADVVRRFVEGYHERTEERFVFPRLEAARREVELVAVLRRQHERGRQVTGDIARLARNGATPELARALRGFVRMYRPHAAREETVLFPAFRALVGRKAYRELGEQFEEQEHAQLGEHGFEGAVAEVARLEVALGVAALAGFTPP